MRLVEFSVTNYRSITKASKLALGSMTVLVGKNNEGKSNLLTALNVAMTFLLGNNRQIGPRNWTRNSSSYRWERDFPLQFQDRKSGLDSIFKMVFSFDPDDLDDFHRKFKIRSNDVVPITVKVGKNNEANISITKQGSSSYKNQASEIIKYISDKISFNYIPTIRTEQLSTEVVERAVYTELSLLREQKEYLEIETKLLQLQQNSLRNLSSKLIKPLQVFLPNVKSVDIKLAYNNLLPHYYRNDIDIIVDDGIPTSIQFKGEGVKSLMAIAMLRNRKISSGASIIAIEEPESHLHSGAIHDLVDVIGKMSDNNQLLITTHNPLFVQQNNISSNVIVNKGSAIPAKNIAEIREVLGIWPSDNLSSVRFVLVVEGENDKMCLLSILPKMSSLIQEALQSNKLIIRPLNSASNLAHDLSDLRFQLCDYVVLLDNDSAGIKAKQIAENAGLLKENQVKLTVTRGLVESEFEDCINTDIYKDAFKKEFAVGLDEVKIKNKAKWSDRMKELFSYYGNSWESLKNQAKYVLANCVKEKSKVLNWDSIVVKEKAGYLEGLVFAIETMINSQGTKRNGNK